MSESVPSSVPVPRGRETAVRCGPDSGSRRRPGRPPPDESRTRQSLVARGHEVAQLMETDKASDPRDIALLCSARVVVAAQHRAQLVEQFDLGRQDGLTTGRHSIQLSRRPHTIHHRRERAVTLALGYRIPTRDDAVYGETTSVVGCAKKDSAVGFGKRSGCGETKENVRGLAGSTEEIRFGHGTRRKLSADYMLGGLMLIRQTIHRTVQSHII
jgi:hypothetical protein